MKRALVTGDKGAAGWYLCEFLRARGDQVYGLGRPHHDLMSPTDIRERLVTVEPQVIYHLAADAIVGESFERPAQNIANNVLGTVNLFEGLRELGMRPVVQVCSSSEVYGNNTHSPIGESWPMAPINPYAVGKATQEMLGHMYAKCYGFKVVTTRAFGYINPRRADLSLTSFARQIALIEAGKLKVLRHGNLESIRAFCDVRDIVRAYAYAADLEAGTFNIGGEEGISIWQCLEALKSMAHCSIPCELEPNLLRPSDLKRVVPDCSLFRQASGWSPTIEFASSLAWLLDCARERVGRGPVG
jgi:GDP-4-dehydro-6-deoxy-D-mannose reductase